MKEGKLKEYFKLIRIYLIGSSATPAVIGALSIKGASLEISTFCILFIMGLLGAIDGFVLNDYFDDPIDKQSDDLYERPLVKGTISRKTALMTVVFSISLNIILLLVFFASILPISLRIISILLTILYNFYSKTFVGSAIFLAASSAFFFLFGLFAVSDQINNFNEIGSMTYILFSLFFIHVFFIIAIEVGLKDIIDDRKAGVNTLAIFLGVKANKKLITTKSFIALTIILSLFTILLAYLPIIINIISFNIWQIISITVCIFGSIWSTIKLVKKSDYNKGKIRNYSIFKEVFGYSLFPLILYQQIGINWTLLILFLPIIWVTTFNYITYNTINPWKISTKDYI